MSGAFAHITVVNHFRESARLNAVEGFPDQAKRAIRRYFKFCELGAVSPDYPYLAIGDSNAAKWADEMHYNLTGDMIKRGVEIVRQETGETQLKALAWLLGYSAHVATDLTIHPVVEMKVGPYQGNEAAHRTCEMHQDAYIYPRMNLADNIGVSEHIDSGISACSLEGNGDRLDTDINRIWDIMLRTVHPDKFSDNPPNIDKWHNGFTDVVDLAEEGNQLFALARHVAARKGYAYPNRGEADEQYLQNLETPNGPKHYDEIFDKAIHHVSQMWSWVAMGVLDDDQSYLEHIQNWNLDTGKNENGIYAFWG